MFWIYLGGGVTYELGWNNLTFGMKEQHFYADLPADIWAPKGEPGYLEETHFVYHLILSVTRSFWSSVRSGM